MDYRHQMIVNNKKLVRPLTIYNNARVIKYPTTHSLPGPYLQSYINLPYRTYMY